jgi:hypothetical protein
MSEERWSVLRTVSGLALRKNTLFKNWDMRLMPNWGLDLLTSTIFCFTGTGSFGLLLPRYRVARPDAPLRLYCRAHRRTVSVLIPHSLRINDTGTRSSIKSFTALSLKSAPYRLRRFGHLRFLPPFRLPFFVAIGNTPKLGVSPYFPKIPVSLSGG